MVNELVQIKTFTMIADDARGVTAEFSLPRKQDNFVFLIRKAGSISGNTYHHGKTPATNPKVITLLTGKIRFSYRKIGTHDKHSEMIEAPAVIEVSPLVTHNVEALTDCMFLDCNSIQDIKDDRVREDV
jgi:hypothetical protein